MRDANSVTVLLSNFALPRHPIASETVHVELGNTPQPASATIRRVDADHANAKALWETMGTPEYPSPEMVGQLHASSAMLEEQQPVTWFDRTLEFDVTVPPLGVAAVRLEFASLA